MSTLTINGTQYKDFTQAFAGNVTAPIAGTYYCLPPWGSPPLETPFTYTDKIIKYTGIFNGIGRKRVAPNGKIITCELIIVSTTKALVIAAASTAMENMNQLARYTITLPDSGTRNNCAALQITESKVAFLGTSYGMMISATFIQLEKD